MMEIKRTGNATIDALQILQSALTRLLNSTDGCFCPDCNKRKNVLRSAQEHLDLDGRRTSGHGTVAALIGDV